MTPWVPSIEARAASAARNSDEGGHSIAHNLAYGPPWHRLPGRREVGRWWLAGEEGGEIVVAHWGGRR